MHRALRLIIATGLPAVGLCLVIGLTTLIVQIGARPGHGRFVSAPEALRTSGGPAGAPPSSLAGGHPMTDRDKVFRSYQGSGPGRRGPFRVGQPGKWGLSWVFSCPRNQAGQFLVIGYSALIGNVISAAAAGPSGHGVTWTSRDPGRHVLTVNSRCQWKIKVVLPAQDG
jgi:hypothetical protein